MSLPLWCYLYVQNDPSFKNKLCRTTVPVDAPVFDLKESIHEKFKNGALRTVDALNLVLWKLRKPIPLQPLRDVAEFTRSISNTFVECSDELSEPSDIVSTIFQDPPEGLLHIIAEAPASATICPSNSHDSKLSDRPAGTTISPSSSDDSKLAAASNEMHSEEKYLRLLCERYWGRGQDGWTEILRHEKIIVPQPPHSDDTVVYEPASTPIVAGPSAISVPVFCHLDHAEGTETNIQTEDSTHEGPEVSYTYICLGPDFKYFFNTLPDSDSMLVREEYAQMVGHLENLCNNRTRGVVVTGQPGIGKSTFLYYVLIYRILEAKATAFQLSARRTFLLLARHDVRVYDPHRDINPVGFPGVWALTDSTVDLVTPRDEFVDTHSKFFLVQAASPQPHRWKPWLNQLSGTLAVMGPWTWEELYIVGTKFDTPRIKDVKTLWDVFTKYGGSARHCYNLFHDPIERQGWDQDIPNKLQALPDLRRLQSLFGNTTGTPADPNNEVLLKTSSQIVAIIPDQNRRPSIAFASQYITDLYYEAVLKNNAEQFWENFNLFWSVNQRHNSAGWMWEGWVISRELRGGPARDIALRYLGSSGDSDVDPAPPIKKQRTIPSQLRLPFTHTATHADMKSLAREISLRFPCIANADHFLFVPGRRNQVTFDAFSISADGCVTLFQPTIQELHSIKASGLDFIWDAIHLAQDKIPALQKLLPTKTKKWGIVFIVPSRVEAKWKYSQSINFNGLQPKQQWTDYIEQFVVAFRDEPPDQAKPGSSHRRELTRWRSPSTQPYPSHSPPSSTRVGNSVRRSPRLRKQEPEVILRSR